MHCNDDSHSSSNPDSRDSDDSFEHSDFENPKAAEDGGGGGFGALGRMQIKVERGYVESGSRTCGCRTAEVSVVRTRQGLGQRG